MKRWAKKGEILGILILVTIIIFATPQAFAQTINACCITSGYTCEFDADTTTKQTCEAAGGTFNATHKCTEIPLCQEDICCKLASGECNTQTRNGCYAAEGSVYAVDLNQCTPAFCNSNTVVIRGAVKYSDSVAATDARIVIKDKATGGEIKSKLPDESGHFAIFVAKSKSYNLTVTAPQNSACTKTVDAAVDESDLNLNDILLPCKSPSSGCQTLWVTEKWDNLLMNCGLRTVTVSPSDTCGKLTLENKPAEYMPCTNAACGNGVLEYGEECDIVSGLASFPDDKNECADFGSNMEGVVSCSSQCKIITDCVSCSGECNTDSMCTHCAEHCADAPLCTEKCSSEETISSFTATGNYINEIKGVSLEWALPASCAQSTIKISRCIGNNDLAPTACATSSILTPIKTLTAGENSYVDNALPVAAESVCYNISATGKDGFNIFTIYSSVLACAPVWDDECLSNPEEPVCSGKQLVVCKNGKVQGTPEDCGCGCKSKTLYSQASCAAEESCNICDVCSGPFGLFPYYDYDLTGISSVYEFCSEAEAYYGQENYCYVDDYSKNKAIIGQYKACHEVSDCYDYKTSASCELNPCSINSAAERNCEWKNLTDNNELGLGVCIPKNQEEQDCTKCNENGILGNYCPQELCELFGRNKSGTTCHFNKVQNPTYKNMNIDNVSCMNIKDVTCETYDTEEECIGPNSAEDKNVSFSANITYDSNKKLVGNDNKYVTLSNDLYKKGKCVWIPPNSTTGVQQGKCIKDSDMTTKIGEFDSDCATKKDSCYKDFTNPQTKLFVLDKEITNSTDYSIDELKQITTQVSERVTHNENKHTGTYISAAKGNAFAYPSYIYTKWKSEEFIGKLRELGSGEITLYFFSVDDAKNVEQVNALNINLLPPLQGQVVVKKEINSEFYTDADSYLTSMVVSVNYIEELQCEVSLTNTHDDTMNIPGNAIKVGINQEWTYNYLTDGDYFLSVYCVDSHLQEFVHNEDIEIDADMSIHNTYPKGQAFRKGAVKLNLTTNNTAKCYYTTDQKVPTSSLNVTNENFSPSVAYWTEFDTTNGVQHTKTVTVNEGGLKYYYPACYFASENRWFTFVDGKNSDIIYFAIDELPPAISIYKEETGRAYVFENESAVESLDLRIVCDDNVSVFNVGTRNYAFGCGDNSLTITKYYKEYDEDAEMVEVGSINRDSGSIISVTAPDNYVLVYLNVSAKDKGGNVNSILQQVNVRNLSFLEPIVQICNTDLETEICS